MASLESQAGSHFATYVRNLDLESLQVMARNLRVLIIVLDQDLKLQFGNDVFFNVVGWAPADVLNRDYVDQFIPPEMRFVVRSTLREIVNKNTDNYSGSNQVLTKNRGTLYINWHSIHQRSQSGKPVGMLCIGIDITEHHGLDNIVKRADLEKSILLKNIAEPVVYHHKDGRIAWANHAFFQALDNPDRDSVIGLHYARFLTHDNDSAARASTRRTLVSRNEEIEPVRLPDGKTWLSRSVPLMEDGIHSSCIMRILTPDQGPKDSEDTKGNGGEHPMFANGQGASKDRGMGCVSESMLKIMEQARIIQGDRSVPVLIEGETGTGKEVLARFVHGGAPDHKNPFIDINCAAITPTIFESELFGYESGAFTGGRPGGRKGKIALAQGGTLFLDEIAEIPVSIQAKLLRVIQERQYYRVGGLSKHAVDVRLICATNVDLEESMSRGAFRKDLFYRLEAIRLRIPPLRERKEDILPLAQYFLQKFSELKEKRFRRIGKEAARILREHSWPGNIRQLRNVIERAVIIWDAPELRVEHLDYLHREPGRKQTGRARGTGLDFQADDLPPDRLDLEALNEKVILEALKAHRWNKTQTAQYLAISRRALGYRLKKLGIE